MLFFKSVLLAFNMYSRLPLAYAAWEEENMHYVLAGFPVVGLVEGLIFILLWKFLVFLNLSNYLRSFVLLVYPLIYTGGIHMDGFMDTVDALASHRDKEKKLEILRDSHVGAFAVIALCIYILLYYILLLELSYEGDGYLYALGFAFIRALSSLALLSMKSSSNRGIGNLFTSRAHTKKSKLILLFNIIFLVIILLRLRPVYACILLLSMLIFYLYYLKMADREFGGLSGDLAGYFLQLAEIIYLLVIILCRRYMP